MGKYEPVIGLEVHVQLSTKSKVFCGCGANFGSAPNSQTCPVCLGLPGSLPVLNKEAFISAVKVALSLNCEIQSTVKFDRKNYYYPDLPKNYQISQYDKPIAYNGSVEIIGQPGKSVAIRRVHLEEDAGKLLHDQDRTQSVVDYNRAGTPLLEIVTEPVIHSPEDAYNYLLSLKTILSYLDVSDCNMEEGSLRCDANISVRPAGQKKLGVKSELKNMNSFKAVRLALEHEIERHIDLLENKKRVVQETRLWDSDNETTVAMRIKEDTHDYRYFPEPDLVPFHVDEDMVKRIKKELPELPARLMLTLRDRYGFKEKEAALLVADKKVADYFEKTVSVKNSPKAALNWITQDIMSELNARAISIDKFGFVPEYLAELISLIEEGTISGKMAKDILRESAKENISPRKIVDGKGLKQISDASEIAGIIDEVIGENAKSVKDYRSGKKNALMHLVGQVMRKTRGKANPSIVGRTLKEKLDSF